MEPTQIQFVVDTLGAIKRRDGQRLAHGAVMRSLVHKQLKQGLDPDNYRVKWLRESIGRILSELAQIGSEFNREHTDDMVSVGDLTDILTSALTTLKSQA
jgi:hypothetical protein